MARGHGGARKGSGRKSDNELRAARALLDSVITDARKKKIITALAKKCEQGDVKAIELWLRYRYGLPPQISIVAGDEDLPAVQIVEVKR